MKPNIGTVDKNIRLSLVVVLLALIAGNVIFGVKAIIAGILAIMLFTTAITKTCPLYRLLGMSTSKTENPENSDQENRN